MTAQKRSAKPARRSGKRSGVGNKRLEELQVSDINDFTKFLPSVTIQPTAPGLSAFICAASPAARTATIRAHRPASAPISTKFRSRRSTARSMCTSTTSSGSSRWRARKARFTARTRKSGTLRIITNKPDTAEFSAAYSLKSTWSIMAASAGWPRVMSTCRSRTTWRSASSAGRKHDAGFIDNVPGTRRLLPDYFAASGAADDNFDMAEDDYNDVDTYGARAALRSISTTTGPLRRRSWRKANAATACSFTIAAAAFRLRFLDGDLSLALVSGMAVRSLGACRADGRRQNRQSRHDLCRRLSEAHGRCGVWTMRITGFLRRWPATVRTFTSEDGVTPTNPAQYIWGARRLWSAKPRIALCVAGRKPVPLHRRAVLSAPSSRHLSALSDRRTSSTTTRFRALTIRSG